MIRVILIFLLLAASVWLGVQLAHDPGYLLIGFHQWTIETTLWIALGVLILVFFLLHFFFAFLSWIIHIPSTWKKGLKHHRIQRAQAKTQQGLIEFSEGQWEKAKGHLIEAIPNSEMPLFNYLTAARASHEMGDFALRDTYLQAAQQLAPQAGIAVELTQAQLQLENQQWQQALLTLKHLQTVAPNHPYVLKLLLQLYEQVQDWNHLIALLPAIKRHKIIDKNTFYRIQKRAYLELMNDLILRQESQSLRNIVSNLPKQLQCDASLMTTYVKYLLSAQHYAEAETILRRCLDYQLDETALTLYSEIPPKEEYLHNIQSLLKKNPHSAPLLLCLGQLSQANHLWGKAKTYFEESIKIAPSPTAFKALGLLLEQLNDQVHACQAFKQGLMLCSDIHLNKK